MLGVVAGYVGSHGNLETGLSPITVGFLGGYTTFSTWMVETLSLTREGGSVGLRTGILNIVLPTAAGLALAATGYALGTLV